jgi:hypothetical protein
MVAGQACGHETRRASQGSELTRITDRLDAKAASISPSGSPTPPAHPDRPKTVQRPHPRQHGPDTERRARPAAAGRGRGRAGPDQERRCVRNPSLARRETVNEMRWPCSEKAGEDGRKAGQARRQGHQSRRRDARRREEGQGRQGQEGRRARVREHDAQGPQERCRPPGLRRGL